MPSARAGWEHVPLATSHVPWVWHASGAGHVIGFPPVQMPARQVSVRVHALASSQGLPSVFAGFEH